jgi:protoporphyrinogen/coproporphyrinogen III oxidase
MTKQIDYLIVGAGISGLVFANELLASGIMKDQILVLEANDYAGGLIKTDNIDGYITEWGPEGLRGNSDQTKRIFELIDEKGIPVSEESKVRYIGKNNKLIKLPSGPISALFGKYLPFSGKLRVFKEPFVKSKLEDETVAEFFERRLGKNIVPLIDAFVTGVYGGNPYELSIKHAFPMIKEFEINKGSIIKGGFNYSKTKKREKKDKGELTREKPPFLMTLKNGMQEITSKLTENLIINYSEPVEELKTQGETFQVKSSKDTYEANHLILATGLNLLQNIKLEGDEYFKEIPIVPEAKVTVLTLGFDKSAFQSEIKGYGFLIPDSENKFIMGTLFSSNLFNFRAPSKKIMIRCFIGGIRHGDRNELPQEEILDNVMANLKNFIGVNADPEFVHFQSHKPRGIPQLNIGHDRVLKWRDSIQEKHKNLKFIGIGWSAIAVDSLVKEAREYAFDITRSS